jgi:two-component system NtrC family sensor kinase
VRTRIGTQVIVGGGLVTLVTIGLTAAFLVRTHHSEMIEQLTRSADQLSETIKSSTHDYMLENRRENLHRQIQAIGAQPGIDRVRLFNKDGQVMFSSAAAEIGHTLDKREEACYGCHAENKPLEKLPTPDRARIFKNGGGAHLLGIVSPIPNQPACWTAACHAHDQRESILGVLDVTVSLADVDRGMGVSQARMAAFALIGIAAGSLFLWWLNRRLVLKPVEALTLGTRRVAEGDLSTKIPVTAKHELGDLARAFNDMTQHLADAQRQLTQADKLASLGRLAAGVAHEINNPLTGVLTYSSFLLKRAAGQPELEKDLEVVVRETKRCREIVQGMLDFARQTPPKRQPTDLNEVARRAVAVVVNQLTLNHVSLAIDLAADLPRVSADGNQIQQVLVNLLLNAADAIGSGGGSGGGGITLTSARTELRPFGHAQIRRATCGKGCDLLTSSTRIGGLPAIRVLRACKGQERVLHLDPIYGRFNHAAAEPCEDGIEATYACPRCRQSLVVAERRCGTCGAPSFAVLAGPGDRVEWCTRTGCHWARWESAEAAGAQPVVELVVADTGAGISVEDQRHLFEPFFTTKGRRGTGLGLAVTWGIVEGHGGSIDVTSELGQGSRFVLRLPLAPAEAAAAPQPALAGASRG